MGVITSRWTTPGAGYGTCATADIRWPKSWALCGASNEAPAETIERDVIELLNDLADEQLLDEDRSKAAAV